MRKAKVVASLQKRTKRALKGAGPAMLKRKAAMKQNMKAAFDLGFKAGRAERE